MTELKLSSIEIKRKKSFVAKNKLVHESRERERKKE